MISLRFLPEKVEGCQQAIAKQAKKCQSRKLKVYNACKKDKLKGKGVPQAQSALDVQVACLQDDPNDPTTGIPDPKNSIQKDCTDKLLGAINGKCAGADLGDLFQGCVPAPANAAELQNCVDYMVECEVCLLLNEIDGLTRDCDDFDDGMANGSCTIGFCDTSGVCGQHLFLCVGGVRAGQACVMDENCHECVGGSNSGNQCTSDADCR